MSSLMGGYDPLDQTSIYHKLDEGKILEIKFYATSITHMWRNNVLKLI